MNLERLVKACTKACYKRSRGELIEAARTLRRAADALERQYSNENDYRDLYPQARNDDPLLTHLKRARK